MVRDRSLVVVLCYNCPIPFGLPQEVRIESVSPAARVGYGDPNLFERRERGGRSRSPKILEKVLNMRHPASRQFNDRPTVKGKIAAIRKLLTYIDSLK